MIGAAFGIGFIVGPVIGGFGADRLPFYVAAVLVAAKVGLRRRASARIVPAESRAGVRAREAERVLGAQGPAQLRGVGGLVGSTR